MIVTKQTQQINSSEFQEGLVLLINKEKSKSSFDAVRDIRKIMNIKKVGHAGTLDPLATGLLILCTGKKTKEIYKYQNMNKVYEGTITLGCETPSMDSETEPTKILPVDGISEKKINEVKESFIGEIEQIPPMYSAIKHKGKSLYKYARKGIDIKREPRRINIYDFKIKNIDLPNIDFKIECSKGTYIRVVASDFGKLLGCGGYLSRLERTKIGHYELENAIITEDLKKIQINDLKLV